MRVSVHPGPFGGVLPPVPAIGSVTTVPAVESVEGTPAARSWQRRALGLSALIALRTLQHLVLLFLLAPVIVLLGGLVVACTVAVLAPFVALPIVHAPVPWPALLAQGLQSVGIQADPRLVPALMAGLAWLGVSSAAMLLLLGIRWP
jgi:hypothetical protein